jgi:hypothetical protein
MGADGTGPRGRELLAVVTDDFGDLTGRAQQHPHLTVVQVFRLAFRAFLSAFDEVADVASATVVAGDASMVLGHGRRPSLRVSEVLLSTVWCAGGHGDQPRTVTAISTRRLQAMAA